MSAMQPRREEVSQRRPENSRLRRIPEAALQPWGQSRGCRCRQNQLRCIVNNLAMSMRHCLLFLEKQCDTKRHHFMGLPAQMRHVSDVKCQWPLDLNPKVCLQVMQCSHRLCPQAMCTQAHLTHCKGAALLCSFTRVTHHCRTQRV